MLMLDRNVIQGRGFRNVMDGGRITGFEFQLRNPNYRGTSASLLDGIDVTIDGERIPDHVPVWSAARADLQLRRAPGHHRCSVAARRDRDHHRIQARRPECRRA